jgi:spore germination cell wall hydrolase CwlJ-like protein
MGRVSLLRAAGVLLVMALFGCAPAEQRRAVQAERAVAAAQPLLRRLALDVPPPEPAAPALPEVTPDAGAPPFLAAAQSTDDRARAEDCLTAAVYYEARSEGEDGQRAVAQVVLNRVRDRAFPASVCGVVYQGANRGTGCQFTFTCDGSLRARRDPSAWERARQVAEQALAGQVYAPVGSATHYHASYVLPWWAASLARVARIGSHLFYRWPGALERALAFRQRYAGVEPGAILPAMAAVTRVALDGDEVTVHRPEAAAAVRTVMASGVRVHLNRAAPEVLPEGVASISDESDAT